MIDWTWYENLSAKMRDHTLSYQESMCRMRIDFIWQSLQDIPMTTSVNYSPQDSADLRRISDLAQLSYRTFTSQRTYVNKYADKGSILIQAQLNGWTFKGTTSYAYNYRKASIHIPDATLTYLKSKTGADDKELRDTIIRYLKLPDIQQDIVTYWRGE